MTRRSVKLLAVICKWMLSNAYLNGIFSEVKNALTFGGLQTQEWMLADKARVNAYHDAILKYVGEGDVVIDLGTGTGILSFFAASKKPKRIYAIEHGEILKMARAAADYNKITNIEFRNVNSKVFEAREKADVLLHDQIGNFLFNERMIEKVVDLRDRVLKKGGRILPNKFELFIEPVKLIDESHIPFIWEQRIHNVNFDCFRNLKDEVKGHYGYRFISRSDLDYFLCEPEKVLSFDLVTIEIGQIPNRLQYIRKISRGGRLDGFCFYFNVLFDDAISVSTSPLAPLTSWGYTPLLRVESKSYKTGELIEFDITMGDISQITTFRWNYRAV